MVWFMVVVNFYMMSDGVFKDFNDQDECIQWYFYEDGLFLDEVCCGYLLDVDEFVKLFVDDDEQLIVVLIFCEGFVYVLSSVVGVIQLVEYQFSKLRVAGSSSVFCFIINVQL